MLSAKDRACKAGPTQWCVFASYLSYPASQKMGKQIAMDGDNRLRMKCMRLHITTELACGQMANGKSS